ncbi:MAG: osmotically inducible protein C, partial [Alphaproteobacteria bacterium HGW-Alphaproteobacteria-17]
DNAQQIFAAARHPKSFVSLDQADHLLSSERDSRYAGTVIAAWAGRFLELETPEVATGVRLSGRTDDGFLCRVQAGRHSLIADEPAANGGTDLGPDPYRYLAAALGSCTVMTLNMYARHKGLAVERVCCDVTHDRIHAEDCNDCEKSSGKIDRLIRRISIEGELDQEQRQRMLEIADRCPVHRTLENEIRIETEAAEKIAEKS